MVFLLGAKTPWASGLASLSQQHRHVETDPTNSRWPFNLGAAQTEVHSLGINGSHNNLKLNCGLRGTVVVVPLVLLLWNKQTLLGRHWSFCFTLNVLLFQTQAKHQLSSWVMKLQKSVKSFLVLSKMFYFILCLDVILDFFFHLTLKFYFFVININMNINTNTNINIKEC